MHKELHFLNKIIILPFPFKSSFSTVTCNKSLLNSSSGWYISTIFPFLIPGKSLGFIIKSSPEIQKHQLFLIKWQINEPKYVLSHPVRMQSTQCIWQGCNTFYFTTSPYKRMCLSKILEFNPWYNMRVKTKATQNIHNHYSFVPTLYESYHNIILSYMCSSGNLSCQ